MYQDRSENGIRKIARTSMYKPVAPNPKATASINEWELENNI